MSAINTYASEYIQFDPKSAAKSLEVYSLKDTLVFLAELSNEVITILLPHLNIFISSSFLSNVDPTKAAILLAPLTDSYCASVLRSADERIRIDILANIPEDHRSKIERIMMYLPDTAGSLMDSSVLPLHRDESVEECIRKLNSGSRSPYYIYLVDDANCLVGVTTMRRLFEVMLSRETLGQIMDPIIDHLRADEDIDSILKNKSWLKYPCLPVIDNQRKFLGVLRYEIFRKLESDRKANPFIEDARIAGHALSELYSIGFSALVGSASSVVPQSGDSP